MRTIYCRVFSPQTLPVRQTGPKGALAVTFTTVYQ